MRVTGGIVVFLGLVASGAAWAQVGDAEQGRMLSNIWCTGCHVVDSDGNGADVGPALPALLGDGVRTADELRGWLASPHPEMPNFDLTRQEIEDIVAYLEALAAAE